MTTTKIFRLLILILGFAVSIPIIGTADEYDPPGRAARLAYVQGSVSFQPAGTEEWVSAVVNRPITTGDRLWTDNNSRAELHIGSAAIRLGSLTGFSFLNLNDDMAQIEVKEGLIDIHLRHMDQNDSVEVDTPNLAFGLLRPDDYRLEVNEAGDTTVVSVRGGEGEVTGGGQAFTIHSNQRASFSGTDQLVSTVDSLGGYDDFDRWSRERDYREEHSVSARYVSRDVIGYQDLDDYGDWRTVPDYGPIWIPRNVPTGWAPYRDGHWAWISPWGWTWVDDDPWGFAPFHYGRWAQYNGVWGWCPGPIAVARPVYAPALVAWVGGSHFNIGIGIGGGGGVGWFPLGPREVYVPPYQVSRNYVNRVNVTNTTVNNTYVTNVYNNTVNNNPPNIQYVNRTVPGAVTATSQATFAAGQPVHKNIVRVDQKQLAQAPVVTRAAIVPQQQSVVEAAPAARAKPPAAVQNRAVVAKTAPPPPTMAFAAQQKAIQSNGGRPLAAQQVRQPQSKPAAEVKVVKPAAKPVPIESVARTPSGQTGQQPNKPTPAPQPAPNHPVQQQPQAQQPQARPRNDRLPAAQPDKSQPPSNQREERPVSPGTSSPGNPNENRAPNNNPTRPDRPPAATQPRSNPSVERPPSSTLPAKTTPAHNPNENRLPNGNSSRPDRPPAAQPNKAQRPSDVREGRPTSSPQRNQAPPPPAPNPSNNRPPIPNPDRPNRPPQDTRDQGLERRQPEHQQPAEKSQERAGQHVEEKRQPEMQSPQPPAENQHQQQEGKQPQQRQEQQRRKTEKQKEQP